MVISSQSCPVQVRFGVDSGMRSYESGVERRVQTGISDAKIFFDAGP